MADATYAGNDTDDATLTPANVRYAEDGEDVSETDMVAPTAEDLADRDKWLAARVTGGARHQGASIITDAGGDYTTQAVSAGMTVDPPNANEVPFVFDVAKTTTYVVTTGIVFDAASAVRRVECWDKTVNGFSIRCFDAANVLIAPDAFVVAFDIIVEEVIGP